MLAGEYSVLLPGGVAWALAVPLGLELSAEAAASWQLVRDDLALVWREGDGEPPSALRFAHAALEVMRERFELEPRRLAMRPARGVASGGQKPGVGGSAAACAAVCAALLGQHEADLDAGRETLFEAALEAHRRAQDGRGSGYDVATVVYGGLTRFEAASSMRKVRARNHRWPTGLHALAGTAHEGSDTRALLARLDARRAADANAVHEALDELGAPVRALDAHFGSGRLEPILAGLQDCRRALEVFEQQLSLGIFTPPIERMLSIGDGLNVCCKISGAGGGDSVIALSDGSEPLERLARAWREAGFAATPLRPAPGVRIVGS